MAEQQTVLGGRYLLKDRVGAGGMASVYRATDQVLDRTVAVKIMLPQYAGDPTFAARFKQEAQAAAGLQSPYIVGVYDWGKDGDTYYIVMEYLRGTDLKSGIRSHGALDPKKVAQIGSQICGALSVAHKHEIVHRDIKPQNIMVQPDGNIKVMDFGIARAKNSHLTQDNNVLGTAHYVSPEQTRGQELGPTSDIYSLGVVMYECATGKVPFDGDDAISVALKQVNELPVPPSQINPGVDGDLERIILKCMEKDPADRFQTADELRRVLNSYLAGRTVDVPEPTRVIGTAGAAGATATRVMADQTQAMARPVGGAAAVNTAARTAAGQLDSSPYVNKRDGMSKGKIAGIAVAVIAVVAIAIFAASGLFAPAKMLPVPNVVGLDQETAVDTIENAGFEVGEVTQGYSDEYPEGEVMEQHPTQNEDESATATEGSKIDIVISQGEEPAETTEVPDLSKATSKAEAERLIRAAGLEPNATEEADDSDEGTILDQSPKAGEEVEVGSTVDFTVSTGPDTIAVPDLTGYTESEARDALSSSFGVSVEYEYSDTAEEGYVIRWDPSGQQAPGSTITVVVSNGPDPSTQQTGVPDLTGLTKAEAQHKLEAAGFVPSFEYADGSSAGVDPDYVISWTPTSASPGSTVTVTVAWDDTDTEETTDPVPDSGSESSSTDESA